LGDITRQAQEDFGRIAGSEVPHLANRVFQSIGQIETLYSDHLTRLLGA
jgi:hypothetical protein